MRMLSMSIVAMVMGLAVHDPTRADDACAACGCAAHLMRVCRPIHTVRRVERDVWDVAHEEHCLPKGLFPFRPCDEGCTGSEGCCDCQKKHAVSRSRKRLIRKTRIEEVPITLWVVEYRCHDCTGGLPELPPDAIGLYEGAAFPEALVPANESTANEAIAPPEINAPRVTNLPSRSSGQAAAAWQWPSLFRLGSKSPSVEDPTNEQSIE